MELTLLPDIDEARALLEAAGLPVVDVTPDLLRHFVGVVSDGTLYGVVGCEPFGHIGLLRSLVVTPGAQGLGLGARLVAAVETIARNRGIERLYLLTTDADRYFARCGYARVDRRRVPEAIRSTTQYSTLCPESAIVMSKRLMHTG